MAHKLRRRIKLQISHLVEWYFHASSISPTNLPSSHTPRPALPLFEDQCALNFHSKFQSGSPRWWRIAQDDVRTAKVLQPAALMNVSENTGFLEKSLGLLVGFRLSIHLFSFSAVWNKTNKIDDYPRHLIMHLSLLATRVPWHFLITSENNYKWSFWKHRPWKSKHQRPHTTYHCIIHRHRRWEKRVKRRSRGVFDFRLYTQRYIYRAPCDWKEERWMGGCKRYDSVEIKE